MSKPDRTDVAVERLLTIHDASDLTRLSPRWWRRAVATGRVGSIKLGGAIRIRLSELERLIAAGERSAR